MTYEFIRDFVKDSNRQKGPKYSIGLMCIALKISRSSYYAFMSRKSDSRKYQSMRSIENEILLGKIKSLFHESRYRYGSPRITAALRTQGIMTGKNRVARIMKTNSIAVKSRFKRKYSKPADKQINSDLVLRQFNPDVSNSTLKKELIYREKYQDVDDLRKSLFEYIEIFYNRQRINSTLGYLSPFEFKTKNTFLLY